MPAKSRQQRWQERKVAQGRCTICGQALDPVYSTRYCPRHLTARREWQRKRVGSKKRYNSLSYRLAEHNRNTKRQMA